MLWPSAEPKCRFSAVSIFPPGITANLDGKWETLHNFTGNSFFCIILKLLLPTGEQYLLHFNQRFQNSGWIIDKSDRMTSMTCQTYHNLCTSWANCCAWASPLVTRLCTSTLHSRCFKSAPFSGTVSTISVLSRGNPERWNYCARDESVTPRRNHKRSV